MHQNVPIHSSSVLAYQYTRTSNTPPRPIEIKRGQYLNEEDWLNLWDEDEDEDEDEDDDN